MEEVSGKQEGLTDKEHHVCTEEIYLTANGQPLRDLTRTKQYQLGMCNYFDSRERDGLLGKEWLP